MKRFTILEKRPRLIRGLKRFLERRASSEIVEMSLALTAVIGLVDQFVEDEISLSVFYLFPIVLATWYARRPAGSMFCLLSTAVWLGVDINTHPYESFWLLFWNTGVRLAFFLITTRLLGMLKTSLLREKAMSRTDSLTQVLNPRGFREVSHRLLHLAARHGHPATLAYVDLDNFKGVNDTLGHAAGDHVLQDVAAMITRNVRATDVVGRLGGDEFAIFMPETDAAGARAAFAKIRTELLREAAEKKYPIGFSIGIAVFPAPPHSLDEAINAADRLMYRVKTSGKNDWLCEEQPAFRPAVEATA